MASQPDTDLADYLPIYLDALCIDTVLDFDLYLDMQGTLVLYREKNLAFGENNRRHLIENQVDRLYVSKTEKAKYQQYIEASLDKIIADEKIPELSKAEIVYQTSKNLVEEVFENPRLGDNIARSQTMVTHMINYILRSREAFAHILQITSFDYRTYTHSVNVCTFTIALAQRMDLISQEILHELGIGALLHDIGKSRVDPKILKKPGALTAAEFEQVKNHPQWGAEILGETNLIPQKSYYPVLQHQERMDGSGYPRGLSRHQIHLYGRITGLCDTFDALTTRRVYKDALDSFPALKIIKDMPEKYDQDILHEFITLIGPEAVAPTTPEPIPREVVTIL